MTNAATQSITIELKYMPANTAELLCLNFLFKSVFTSYGKIPTISSSTPA